MEQSSAVPSVPCGEPNLRLAACAGDGEPHPLVSVARDVLDRLLEGCQVIGFDWTYLYINDVAATHARVARDQLVGRSVMACFPGIEHTAMFALLRRAMTERTHHQLENEFVYPDGARSVFELHVVPVPQGICVLSLDATARRHRLAAIVEDSEDAIIGRALDGTITSWNRGAERLFGYTAGEIVGQHFERLLPAQGPRPDPAATARLAAGERTAPFEGARMHKDGRLLDVSITLSPYRDLTGAVVGISMIARDIADLKRIQRELVAARDAAQDASRELEAFAHSVAHDLRAPLRHVDGFSLALLEESGHLLDDHSRGYLQRIRGSTQLMSRLIDDLLKLSRVTRQDLARTRVDVSALADAALSQLRIDDPGRRVNVMIEDGLVDTGDERLLAVALDNLLGNAWKFTAKRPDARIEVGATSHDGAPCYFVRDNGVGFSMAHAPSLFAPFRRLHAADEFEGTGIGLATVQRIIHRHGGRVWADAAVGTGATFYFTLRARPHP